VPRFSDRIGATQAPKLANSEMTEELRTALWNVVDMFLFHQAHEVDLGWRARLLQLHVFLHWRLDELTWTMPHEKRVLGNWWFGDVLAWYEIYNVIDFLAPRISESPEERADFCRSANMALEVEGSPYRFVGETLTVVTAPEEISEVEAALATGGEFAGARAHLSKALEFLATRPEPQYRNSISESILAVESTLKTLTGLEQADLADALRAFAKSRPIHPALFSGLDKLYGYTSNEHGLRHALLDADARVGFAEAKFMVVACAAFMNFLIAKSTV
jgi:hypothetical protein